MKDPLGIGKLERERLAALLRETQHTISVAEAAKILGLPPEATAKLLSRWMAKGWLSRVKQGLYVPVPLESLNVDVALEDPWIIAEKLYHPCYIGGWSAAEHWGLTEQIFRTIVVFSTNKLKNHNPVIKGTSFLLRTISSPAMFGLETIWRGEIKISVSNPTRTILDFLNEPKLGGGIRSTADMLSNYLKSEYKDLPLLINYAKQLKNGAVFKRLGFLLEKLAPQETEIIDLCKKQLTKGNIQLDPQLNKDKLITRWRLWIPESWK